MDLLWQALTVIAVVWIATEVVDAILGGRRPQAVRPSREMVIALLSIAGLLAYMALMGVWATPGPAVVTAGGGAFAGYLMARRAGFESWLGVALVLRSGAFMIVWGAAALIGIVAGAGSPGTPLAIGLLGLYAATGANIGRGLFLIEAAGLARDHVVAALDAALDRQCTECRAELDPDSAVCPTCRADNWFCTECGAHMSTGGADCPACGSRVVAWFGPPPGSIYQRFCFVCARSLSPKAIHCDLCGTPQPPACDLCGTEVFALDVECPLCGIRTEDAEIAAGAGIIAESIGSKAESEELRAKS